MSKPTVRVEEVVSFLRRNALSGDYAPGSRIPTCRALQKETGASHLTVYTALRRLQKEGLFVARGRLGTFVQEAPPHLHEYGFVWAGYANEKESILFRAIEQVLASDVDFGGKRRIRQYGAPGSTTRDDYDRLFADVQERRIAGVIMAPSTQSYQGTPLDLRKKFPLIALLSGQAPSIALMDYVGFLELSIQSLKEQGCRRVAVLCPAHISPAVARRELEPKMKKAGMNFDPRLLHAISFTMPEWALNILSLMWDVPASRQPDGLLIMDDNGIAPIMKWVSKNLSRDFPLAALANFPAVPKVRQPVSFVGFDAAVMIRQCLDALEGQDRGKIVTCVRVPAIRQSEAGRLRFRKG